MSELTAVEKHQQEFNQKVKGMKEEIEDNFEKDDIIDLLVTTELSNEKLREENKELKELKRDVKDLRMLLANQQDVTTKLNEQLKIE